MFANKIQSQKFQRNFEKHLIFERKLLTKKLKQNFLTENL
jgi:hypothetical protein